MSRPLRFEYPAHVEPKTGPFLAPSSPKAARSYWLIVGPANRLQTEHGHCSVSTFSRAPTSITMIESHIQVMKPMTAPSEP